MARVQTTLNGQQVDADEINFMTTKKIWGKLELENGTTIKVELHINGLLAVPSHTDENGNPAYLIRGSTEMTITQPKGTQQ